MWLLKYGIDLCDCVTSIDRNHCCVCLLHCKNIQYLWITGKVLYFSVVLSLSEISSLTCSPLTKNQSCYCAQQSLRLSVKTVILCCQFLFSASPFQHYIIVLQLTVLHHIRLKSVTQHQQEVFFGKESTIHFSLYIPYFAKQHHFSTCVLDPSTVEGRGMKNIPEK